jgi:hypothetical protein
MAKRIERLTPAQEAELPRFREDWRAVGLSTDPIAPDSVRENVRALYAAGETCAGPPKRPLPGGRNSGVKHRLTGGYVDRQSGAPIAQFRTTRLRGLRS